MILGDGQPPPGGWKDDFAEPPYGELDRDGIQRRNWKCEECSGWGLTSRAGWSRKRQQWVTVSCYCPCEAGRWHKEKHAKDPSLIGRIIDLADRPDLMDNPRQLPSQPETEPSQR
jgi:hypothetical protein